MNWTLEVVVVPVSDIDRAKQFYAEKVGFVLDHDRVLGPGRRVVQLTPPGSGCSIAIGTGITDAPPGSVQGMQLVVPDIEAAHEQLSTAGVGVGEIQDLPWGSFVFFEDPDGNVWAVQELKRGG